MRNSTACTALFLTLLCGCDDVGSWDSFGSPAELEVQVGVSEILPAVEAIAGGQVAKDLPVADILLEPGGGPVGTEHTLEVTVVEDFEADVQRVTVRVDAGSYGTDVFELEQDPAFMGVWAITLESLGDETEAPREDTLTVKLWSPAGDDAS